MGPKKGRRVRKREVPTDSVSEFELGTRQKIYSLGGRRGREAREREEEAQKQRKEEARRVEATALARGGSGGKCARTDRSDTETEAGGEAGTSQLLHSRYKKGHMTSIYQTDSDEETIMDM